MKLGRLMMNGVLLVAVIITAMYVVGVRYSYRRAFTVGENELNYQKSLLAEIHELQAQNRKLLTPVNLERIANSKLKMQSAINSTWYVQNPEAMVNRYLQAKVATDE